MEDFQFDEHIFQMGWFNHQPDNYANNASKNIWMKDNTHMMNTYIDNIHEEIEQRQPTNTHKEIQQNKP